LNGSEKFTFHIGKELKIGMIVKVTTDTGLSFNVKARLDTEPEIEYYKVGGILIYVMKRIMNQ
jgi:aconitate hydratase